MASSTARIEAAPRWTRMELSVGIARGRSPHIRNHFRLGKLCKRRPRLPDLLRGDAASLHGPAELHRGAGPAERACEHDPLAPLCELGAERAAVRGQDPT